MSEMVTYKGKIKEVDIGTMSIDEWCFSQLSEDERLDIDNDYTATQMWQDNYEYNNEYAILNGKIYKVISKKDVGEDSDIYQATKCEDGTFEYLVHYYNGGMCFSEALESALEEV